MSQHLAAGLFFAFIVLYYLYYTILNILSGQKHGKVRGRYGRFVYKTISPDRFRYLLILNIAFVTIFLSVAFILFYMYVTLCGLFGNECYF